MTPRDVLAEAARRRPRARAVSGPAGTLTYEELDREASAYAGWLRGEGVRPGHRVAAVLPGDPASVVAFHGIQRSGGVLCPLHPSWTPDEVERAAEELRPALILSEVGVAAGRGGSAGRGRMAERGERTRGGEAIRRGDPAAPGGPDGAALVLWTSGTGGRPRGVALSPENLAASAAGARARLELSPSDRWLLSLNPAHVGGAALLHRAAVVGAEVVAMGPFEVERVSDLLERGAVTHVSLVPAMFLRLLERRGARAAPDSLRLVLLGGQATPAPLLERGLEAGYPVALTYGLTEATSQVATAPPDLVRRKPGSVGPPLPGVEVSLGEGGEIRVRGATVAMGVLRRREEDASGPDGLELRPLAGPDGWLATGDVGRLDGEGHLRVVGRLSRRIISGGVTVDPGEVEEAILAHPGVREVAVTGMPDPEWGERVAALVVPRGEGSPEGLEASLHADLRARLAPAKRPREIRLLRRLPRTATGKVDDAEVRRLLG